MPETSARIFRWPARLQGARMGEYKRRRPRKADGRRRGALRFERVRVDAPPALSTDELAFPWATHLAIGADPVPSASRPRQAPPPTRRRNPVAE
jgi:hypothetical protein